MIVYMARRVLRARRLDGVVVVTSTDPSDTALAAAVSAAGLPTFRGDLHDVLSRYSAAAQAYGAEEIVRLTGDCPLIDPAVIDSVIEARRAVGADYASNIDPATFPDGLDVEICTRETLERAEHLASLPVQREHVTLWMRSAEAGLARANVRAISDLSHLRVTVDYPDDLDVVREIIAEETNEHPLDLFDILRIMSSRPDLLTRNPHARNEGLAKSLAMPENITLPGATL